MRLKNMFKKPSDRWLTAGAVLAVVVIIRMFTIPNQLIASGVLLVLMMICFGLGTIYEARGR